MDNPLLGTLSKLFSALSYFSTLSFLSVSPSSLSSEFSFPESELFSEESLSCLPLLCRSCTSCRLIRLSFSFFSISFFFRYRSRANCLDSSSGWRRCFTEPSFFYIKKCFLTLHSITCF